MTGSSAGLFRTLLSVTLMVVTVAWVTYLLYEGRSEIASVITSLDMKAGFFLILSLLFGCASLAVSFFIWRALLLEGCSVHIPQRMLAASYFAGQVVRYLPGRFLGLVYQVNEIRPYLHPMQIIRSTIMMTLLSLIVNTGFSITLITLLRIHWFLALMLLMAFSGLVYLYLRFNWTTFFLRFLHNILPGKVSLEIMHDENPKVSGSSHVLHIITLYFLSWLLYLVSWLLLRYVFPPLDSMQLLLICATYTLSWAIGFISLITPGGLGVRELAFVFLAADIVPPAMLAFFSVFLRFWLMAMDIVLMAATFALIHLRGGTSHACNIQERRLPPVYDDRGRNILDPKDYFGVKSQYITLLNEKALARYLPSGTPERLAVDLGCGYGRMIEAIARKGWKVVGIDADPRLVEFAKASHPFVGFTVASMPNLSLPEQSIDLLVLNNVLRMMHIVNELHHFKGTGRFVKPGGLLFITENIRDGDSRYIAEHDLLAICREEGFELVSIVPIRAARWWVTIVMSMGLIPRSWLDSLAEHELNRMNRLRRRPRWQYYNMIFLLKKT